MASPSQYAAWQQAASPSPADAAAAALASPHIPRQLFHNDADGDYGDASPQASPHRPGNGGGLPQQQAQPSPAHALSIRTASGYGYAEDDYAEDGGSIAANAAASLFTSDMFDAYPGTPTPAPGSGTSTPSRSASFQSSYPNTPSLIPNTPLGSLPPFTSTSPTNAFGSFLPTRPSQPAPGYTAKPAPLPKTIVVHADRMLAYADPAPGASPAQAQLRPAFRRRLDEIMSQAHVRINVRRPAAQVPPGGITGQLGNPGIEVTPCAEADAERLGQVEVEIAGLGDRVEIARVKVLVMLDEMTGLRSLNLNLEPSHPNMFHNVIAGPRRRTLRAVMRRTRTNIYFPSPFVVQSVEMAAEAAGMVITGVGASVDEAVRVLRELADQKKPQIVSHTLTFPTHKLDWMLANRRDVLTRTMWDNGTFVLFPVAGQGTPQGAPSCRLVTVLGDDRVYVERTIRMLTLLACECYVACIDLSHPVHSIPAAADAAAGFNGWPASPAAAQAPFQELDWKALLENVAQTTRAVVVLRDQGRAIEVLGVEATAKSAHATLAEHPSLRPYVSRAHFRIGLAQEHRDFVRGKKDGKIARIIKGSGGCNVRVEDDRNGRTVTVVVEHHDPGRVLEGVALAEEELPAELAFHLPERYHKQAIGVGGRRIQAIMRRREAYVKFASSEEVSRTGGFDVGEVGDNVIVRTPARNARNLELVRRDVEAAVGWAEGGNGDGSVAITMRIPRRFHRRVAARGGVFGSGYPGAEGDQDAVHEIEERTGTRIRLPDRELGVDEVAIEGPQRGVEAAAKVLQALVPGLVQMALPAQAAAAVGSAEFAGYADRALREYETEVRTYVPGAAQDKDAGSPDGQAGGKSEVGRDEPIDLLVEADDPQFADEIAWHSIAPFLSSQGVPLPARRPPINASTSGLHHFDHRLLVDTVQREREMRERDIMMRAVSEQQGARMAMYEEEMAGEEDERGWSSPTGYHPRHRGSISAADREAYYDGRRGSQRRPPAQADDEWAYALGQTFVPRTPFPPTSGRMPPGFGSPQTPNSPTRTYSQGPRPNTVPRSGAGGYGGGGGGLRLNMGGQYSGGRYAAMTPPRPGAVQSPQSARTPFSANAQSFSASTPIGTHPPLGAYYSYDGAAEQETPSLSAIQAPAAAPPSDEHPQAVEPARYGDGEPGAPRDDAGAEGQIEGTFAKNGDPRIYNLLQRCGLEKYHSVFTEQEVDYSTFVQLTDSDLRELGVPTFGARKRILTAVQEDRRGARGVDAWPSPESRGGTVSADTSVSEDADPGGVAAALAGLSAGP